MSFCLQDGSVSSQKDRPVFPVGLARLPSVPELTRGRELGMSLLRCSTSFNPLIFNSVLLLPFFILRVPMLFLQRLLQRWKEMVALLNQWALRV